MRNVALKISLLFFVGAVIGIVASILYLRPRIYPRTTVAGVKIGGMMEREAVTALEQKVASKLKGQLLLRYNKSEWILELAELGYRPLLEDSVKQAYKKRGIGRLYRDPLKLSLRIKLDEVKLQSQIATISAQLSFPAQEPELSIENGKVEVSPGQDGQKLDKIHTFAIIKKRLTEVRFEPIDLPVTKIDYAVTPEQLETTRQRAERLLNKELILTMGKNENRLRGKELIDLLSFQNGFRREKIATYAATLAESYNRQPQNASFRIENGKVILFRPAVPGIGLNEQIAKEQIYDNLVRLQGSVENSLTLNLAVVKTAPEIDNSDVNDLGINELLGKGISYYTGSALSRIHNLTLAASRINGTLIAPGEVFSFNESIGDISAATGYQSAYIIKDGRTILGDGGGVCQDSTTLFRAVLDAGLPIAERYAHSYRVVYYEKGNFKPGLDATVFTPSVDFKFRNDTPQHLLIQAYTTPAQSKLTYEIYGTSDERVATITNHRVWDKIPPPEPLYQDDPTLPAGTVKQIDFAAWGAKAAFDYTVKQGGEVLIERTFYSNFRPWQAVYLKGTQG